MIDSSHSAHTTLSRRARRLLGQPPVPEYLREHFARLADPALSRDYIPLCLAENRLVWDLLRPKLAACRDTPERALAYDTMIGSLPFRGQLARHLGRTILGRGPSPEHLAVLAGAGSVLEALFYALGDEGDGVLVPTPSYPGFWMDLETRDGLAIVPVECASADGFRLTPERLDRALAAAGRPIRALLFTSPNNPLGRVYTPAEVEAVIAWTEAKGIHLVCDEVYALSVFGERPFTSAARLRPRLGDRLHVVWAFSKDFAASGLRCGVLISENEALHTAMETLAEWACCSGDTQALLGTMIEDQAWVDSYAVEMRRRLGEAHRRVTAALDEEGIPCLPAEAGFFLLVDLRDFLQEPTRAAEHALWRRLLDEGNVSLTPGTACHSAEPGFMRLCFANVPAERTLEGVRRVGALLRRERALG